MPFACPQCRTYNGLKIIASIELPPDRDSEEITLQVVSCKVCGFKGLALYEESRRSFYEGEDWKHIGYWVSPDAVESVMAAIHSCPDPFNDQCDCPAHTILAEGDAQGVWKGLLEMQRGHTFLMRMAMTE